MPFRAVPGRQRQARWGRELSGPQGSGVPAPGAESPCRGEAQQGRGIPVQRRGPGRTAWNGVSVSLYRVRFRAYLALIFKSSRLSHLWEMIVPWFCYPAQVCINKVNHFNRIFSFGFASLFLSLLSHPPSLSPHGFPSAFSRLSKGSCACSCWHPGHHLTSLRLQTLCRAYQWVATKLPLLDTLKQLFAVRSHQLCSSLRWPFRQKSRQPNWVCFWNKRPVVNDLLQKNFSFQTYGPCSSLVKTLFAISKGLFLKVSLQPIVAGSVRCLISSGWVTVPERRGAAVTFRPQAARSLSSWDQRLICQQRGELLCLQMSACVFLCLMFLMVCLP